jgi:hypothetical protein
LPCFGGIDELTLDQQLASALGLQFRNMRALRQIIDDLPGRGDWMRQTLSVEGLEESFELYYRDSRECLKSLYGDPAFADVMEFAPVMEFPEDEEDCECAPEEATEDADGFWCDGSCGRQRSYSEMSTGRRWWKVQVSFLWPHEREWQTTYSLKGRASRGSHSRSHLAQLRQDDPVRLQRR